MYNKIKSIYLSKKQSREDLRNRVERFKDRISLLSLENKDTLENMNNLLKEEGLYKVEFSSIYKEKSTEYLYVNDVNKFNQSRKSFPIIKAILKEDSTYWENLGISATFDYAEIVTFKLKKTSYSKYIQEFKEKKEDTYNLLIEVFGYLLEHLNYKSDDDFRYYYNYFYSEFVDKYIKLNLDSKKMVQLEFKNLLLHYYNSLLLFREQVSCGKTDEATEELCITLIETSISIMEERVEEWENASSIREKKDGLNLVESLAREIEESIKKDNSAYENYLKKKEIIKDRYTALTDDLKNHV